MIRLDHASIMTANLEASVAFYENVLDLSLRVVEDDPIRDGRRRAMLTDSEGCDLIEIMEVADMEHPTVPGRGGIHHLGFALPEDEWHALRSRLDAEEYPYQEVGPRLFVRDADGLVLEIETT